MNPTINISRLIRNLRDVEELPVRKPPAFLADMGDGVSYLFTALISPLIDGREVHSSSIWNGLPWETSRHCMTSAMNRTPCSRPAESCESYTRP